MASKAINSHMLCVYYLGRLASFFILRADWMTTQLDSILLLHRCQDSSVRMAMGYRLDSQGSIPGKSKSFLFSTAFRLALRLTQLPIQCVLGA
jgi:hypothetical protein